jgi:type II secretory pathway component PulF
MAIDLAKLQHAAPGPAARPAAETHRDAAAAGAHPLSRLARIDLFSPRRVPLNDLVVFTQQIVLLLRSGNGLVPSVRAIAAQTKQPLLHTALTHVHAHLESGRVLSECLELHPEAFDTLYVSVVRAGEASGQLAQCLDQLALILETRRQLRGRIREAMAYPTLLMVVMAIVVVFMFVYMVPRFGDLFGNMGSQLPWSTRLILAAGGFLRSRWWIVLPIAVLAGAVVRKIWREPAVQAVWDRAKLAIPVAGGLFSESYQFQLFSSLGLLLGSRVPHLDAIRIVRRAIRHAEYERFFDQLANQVEAGRGVAQAFQEAKFLPDTVKLMIATGESAGALDTVMLSLSDRYRMSLESDIRRLSSLMEPLLLVVMGLMVGFIAVSFILPLFRLSRMVR